MEKLSLNSIENLKLLIGCEVQSLKYEGCVYINGRGRVFLDGEVIDTLDSDKKVRSIWKEYLKNEGL